MHNNTEPSFIAEQENNDKISKESSFQKDFNDKQPAAESHLEEHKGKLFACTLCDRSFVNVQGLNSHMDATHRQLKPFNCSSADKSNSNIPDHDALVHNETFLLHIV